MQTLSHIKNLLETHGMAPKHALGQNFLIDHNLLTRLVEDASLTTGDLILEVGPGTGTLSETLLEHGCDVIACELDDGLTNLLQNTIGTSHPNSFTLIHGDCLETKRRINAQIIEAIAGRSFKLVANLPYQAATPLLLTLLLSHPNCRSMHVTIQQEVADRILSSPGSKTYGELSIITQALAECRRVASLPPGCFWPQPKVTSAMISIRRRESPLADNPAQLVALTSRLFATRRKQLGSILGRDHPLPPGVDATSRPESLSVEQMCELARLSAL